MKYLALTAAFAAILPLAAAVAPPVTVTLDNPETAGICGYRKMWDQPVMTGADGLRVIIEPLDKEYAIKDRGGVAPWATPTLEAAGKPAALAFDAIHRTLLVRFPDAAERIAAQVNQGYRIEKLEMVLPFEDEELWPEQGRYTGYGYRTLFLGQWETGWNVEWGYRAVRPRWHAVAWALKKPWMADPKLGPTYNAYINGAGYWAHFGAQGDGSDRLPTPFGPVEVSYREATAYRRIEPAPAEPPPAPGVALGVVAPPPAAFDSAADTLLAEMDADQERRERPADFDQPARMNLTALLTDTAYGTTLAERLRNLADCGVALKKWETYDHLYYDSHYEWGTGVGGRAIIIRPPSLAVTFVKAADAPRIAVLPPAANIPALAESLKKSGGGQPTAVMPSPDQIKALAQRFGPQQPEWMPDWQWRRVEELLAGQRNVRDDDPFWMPFVTFPHTPEMQRYFGDSTLASLRASASEGETTVGPANLVASYEAWVDHYLERPHRGWHGHGTIADLIQPWFEYREALPGPVHEWYRNNLAAFLMPDRPTADTHEKRWDRNYIEGPLVHPMVDSTALGAKPGTTPSIREKRFDTYVAKTGDWRGNKSFYRSGFCYTISTANFNASASLAALVGGGIIGSEYAMTDGRHGQISYLTRLWTWFDGSSQEEIDDYYFTITMKSAKLMADYAPEPFDRLLARSQLAKATTLLADAYHPGLRRYVAGAGRTALHYRLGTQDGIYSMLHTLSKSGAITDLGSEEVAGGLPKWGSETPPHVVARQALVSPYAPLWYQGVVDEKPIPFETTSAYKVWGGHATYPIMRRSYLGHHFGLFSENAQTGFLPITAHWRRQNKQAATSRDIGTMVARFGVVSDGRPGGQTWFPDMAGGWIRPYGNQAVLQSGPRMIIATSPIKLDSGYRVSKIQSSLAFYNYEDPEPTWEIYVDGQRQGGLPLTAKAGQRITIRDGFTYIGIIPLPSTDLGRTDEVVIQEGVRQQHGPIVKAALVIDNLMHQGEYAWPLDPAKELPGEGTDWDAIDKAHGGFVVEFGDAESYQSFADFQRMLKNAKLETTFDAEISRHEIRYRSGDDVLEMGVYTTFDINAGSGPRTLDALFAYQRVNGESPYLPAGIERDSPFNQQATTGRIEKGGAVLRTTPGQTAVLQWEPHARVVSAWNPLPDLNAFALRTPAGVEIAADGKIGLACVTLEPRNETLTVEHAYHGAQADDTEAATALLAFGMEQETRVVVNGRQMPDPATLEIEGRRALVIPLVAEPPSGHEIAKRYQAAQALLEPVR